MRYRRTDNVHMLNDPNRWGFAPFTVAEPRGRLMWYDKERTWLTVAHKPGSNAWEFQVDWKDFKVITANNFYKAWCALWCDLEFYRELNRRRGL